MAKTPSKLLSYNFHSLFSLLFFSITLASGKLMASQKSYCQKNLASSGRNSVTFTSTSMTYSADRIRVASAAITRTSRTAFGALVMADDHFTAAPERDSKLVEKAQWIYASAAQAGVGFLTVMNFAFLERKYNRSSLSLLGRNTIFSSVREMQIVRGSGLFRFARGYAHAKTHTVDAKSGDAVVEDNVYVFHY